MQTNKRTPAQMSRGFFLCRADGMPPPTGLDNRLGKIRRTMFQHQLSLRAEGVAISWYCITNLHIVPGDRRVASLLAMTRKL